MTYSHDILQAVAFCALLLMFICLVKPPANDAKLGNRSNMKLVPLDKYGWPVERIRGRPIINAIRLLIHTRRIISRAEWQRREAARNSFRNGEAAPTQSTK